MSSRHSYDPWGQTPPPRLADPFANGLQFQAQALIGLHDGQAQALQQAQGSILQQMAAAQCDQLYNAAYELARIQNEALMQAAALPWIGMQVNAAQLDWSGTQRDPERDERAAALLKSILSEDQRTQYDATRTFEVITCRSGQRRRYKVTHGWAGNVFLLDDSDREIEKFCIHPARDVPVADSLISQKLLLESNEDEFLRIANRAIRVRDGWRMAA